MSRIENIRIGTRRVELGFPLAEVSKLFIGFEPRNQIFYLDEPSVTLDGTTRSEYAKAFYRPTVSVKFNYLSEQEYRQIIQILNTKSFVIEYYDIELGQLVVRRMTLDDYSKNLIIDLRNNLHGISDLEFSFESVFAYDADNRYGNLLVDDTKVQ